MDMLMSLNRATHRGFSIVIVTLLAVLLTTCTSESEVEQLRAEIAELRTELAAEQVVIAEPTPTPKPEPNATPIAATPTPVVVVVVKEVIVEKIVEKVVTVVVTPTPIPSPATAGAAVANRLAALGWSESEALAVAKKVRASTVIVDGGAGWVAASDLVVTNGHVTPEVGETVSLETITGVHLSAVVLESSLNPDLAILRVTSNISELPPPLSIGTTSPGNPVMTVGHSSIVGNWVVTVGEVVSVPPMTPEHWILVDLTVSPGNSGGPAVNQDGEVIGVVSGSTNEGFVSPTGVYDLKIILDLEDYFIPALPSLTTIEPWGFVAAMIQRHQ